MLAGMKFSDPELGPMVAISFVIAAIAMRWVVRATKNLFRGAENEIRSAIRRDLNAAQFL